MQNQEKSSNLLQEALIRMWTWVGVKVDVSATEKGADALRLFIRIAEPHRTESRACQKDQEDTPHILSAWMRRKMRCER